MGLCNPLVSSDYINRSVVEKGNKREKEEMAGKQGIMSPLVGISAEGAVRVDISPRARARGYGGKGRRGGCV
jgi:hypothetical protein